MRNMLEKLSKEKLIDFIIEYLENDANFANAVNVYFAKPEFEQEIRKIERSIDNAFSGAAEYRKRGNWRRIMKINC